MPFLSQILDGTLKLLARDVRRVRKNLGYVPIRRNGHFEDEYSHQVRMCDKLFGTGFTKLRKIHSEFCATSQSRLQQSLA